MSKDRYLLVISNQERISPDLLQSAEGMLTHYLIQSQNKQIPRKLLGKKLDKAIEFLLKAAHDQE